MEADNIIPILMQLLDCLTKSDLNIVLAEPLDRLQHSASGRLQMCVTAPRCECTGLYECVQRSCALSKILPWMNKDC